MSRIWRDREEFPSSLGRFYMSTCISSLVSCLCCLETEHSSARCLHALLPLGKYKAGKLRATGIYSSSDVLRACAACKLQQIPSAKPVLFVLNTGKDVGEEMGI